MTRLRYFGVRRAGSPSGRTAAARRYFIARSTKNPIASSAIRSATSGPALVSVAMAAPPVAFASERDDCSASNAPAGGSGEDVHGAAVSGALVSESLAGVSTGGCSVTVADVSAAGDGSLPADGCAAVSTSVTAVVSRLASVAGG